MLVISRKKHEEVWVGDNIRIVVVGTRSGSVKLAIEAPPEVPILRGELMQRRKEAVAAARPQVCAN